MKKSVFVLVFIFCLARELWSQQPLNPNCDGDGSCCSDYNSPLGAYGQSQMPDVVDWTNHTAGDHYLTIYPNLQRQSCAYTAGTWDPQTLQYNCITHAATTGGAWSVGELSNSVLNNPSNKHCAAVSPTLEVYQNGEITASTCGGAGGAFTEIPKTLSCVGNSPSFAINSGWPNQCVQVTVSTQNQSYPGVGFAASSTPWGTCPFETAPLGTPLVIAGADSKFQNSFTSFEDGVTFGFGNGITEIFPMSWTKKGADVGFLVLPNAAGHVESLKGEMFGNLTIQRFHVGAKLGGTQKPDGKYEPYKRNGFEALAYYDLLENGGNGNGLFDPGDKAWSRVRVWYNLAHDGLYDEINKPSEIKTLDELGISAIDVVNYSETPIVDGHGNKQMFVGSITSVPALQIYDVVLVTHKSKK
jgi:hypothetical protein